MFYETEEEAHIQALKQETAMLRKTCPYKREHCSFACMAFKSYIVDDAFIATSGYVVLQSHCVLVAAAEGTLNLPESIAFHIRKRR